MDIDDYHEQRVRFLLPLSMTCKEMRLRLLPWVWEHIECLELAPRWGSEGSSPWKLDNIMGVLSADTTLAINVKYLGCALLSPSIGADPYPPKIHDGARDVE